MITTAFTLAAGGCSDTLLRETVLANTETMVGVAVAQDPRTNMYQGRAGYFRHELFLVPTSKRVAASGENASAESNDPGSTPEVLGEIMADGAIASPIGGSDPVRVGVYQRLAVGKLAVTSGAAVALLARDAATAATTQASTDRSLEDLATASKGATFSGKPWPDAADQWSRELGFANYDDLYAKANPRVQHTLARRWSAELRLAQTRAAQPSQPVQPISKGGAQ